MAAKGPKGYMAQLKQRLGERFPLLKEISQNFQHGQMDVATYCEVALDILEGDVETLLQLVERLPSPTLKVAVLAHCASDGLIPDPEAYNHSGLQPEAPAPVPSARTLPPRCARAVANDGNTASPPPVAESGPEGDYMESDMLLALQHHRSLNEDHDEPDMCQICLDAPASVLCKPCGHPICKGCLQLWRQTCKNPTYDNTGAFGHQVGTTRKKAATTPCPFCRVPIKSYTPLASAAHDAGLSELLAEVDSASTPNPIPQHGQTSSVDCVTVGRGAAHGQSPTGLGTGSELAPSQGDRGAHETAQASTSTRTHGIVKPRGGKAPVIMWFRQDMRIRDNPALYHAASKGVPVIPVFILAPDEEEGEWPMGGATRYWLHHSLKSLDSSLRAQFGSRLIFRRPLPGKGTVDELLDLVVECGAQGVFFNRVYEPWRLERDKCVEKALGAIGVAVRTFNALLLYEPWDAQPDNSDESCWNSGFGSVRFFLNGCNHLGSPAKPLESPSRVQAPSHWPSCAGLQAMQLADLPRSRRDGRIIDWAAGIRKEWAFGEEGAEMALAEFVDQGLERFDVRTKANTNNTSNETSRPPSERFRADKKNTARISPYMHFGELGPRQVYYRVVEKQGHNTRSINTFLRRLAWRDLAYWALWRFPYTALRSLRPQYEFQRWRLGWAPADSTVAALQVKKQRWDSCMQASSDPRLKAWQRGETGYPLVDAAMKELWITGYTTNYMRHVTAGFLIEFLNIDWRHGELWYHDTLVDADVPIQAMMWQNGGHSGMDQWNFVMHPVFAAKTCDPDGDYVRRWLPVLKDLPREFIHNPWEAPATLLAAAGVTLGRNYPKRILTDLDVARRDSLAAVVELREGEGARYVLPDGNEALHLPDGRIARCITRVDYKVMAKEPITRQTAAAAWDIRRRVRTDFMSTAMADCERQAGRTR